MNRGDSVEVASFDPAGASLGTVSFTAPEPGLGTVRSTPLVREWAGFAALALEPGDPVCYAPSWRTPAAGGRPKDVLMQVSLGDMTVPVFTGATLGRAAGLISPARNDLLIREGVLASGTSSNVDRRFGVESTFGAGIRFLGVNSHIGMLVPDPNNLTDAAHYAEAAQRQALGFIETGWIDDSDPMFDRVLP